MARSRASSFFSRRLASPFVLALAVLAADGCNAIDTTIFIKGVIPGELGTNGVCMADPGATIFQTDITLDTAGSFQLSLALSVEKRREQHAARAVVAKRVASRIVRKIHDDEEAPEADGAAEPPGRARSAMAARALLPYSGAPVAMEFARNALPVLA